MLKKYQQDDNQQTLSNDPHIDWKFIVKYVFVLGSTVAFLLLIELLIIHLI